ncbi:EF-hand domain-containing protein [Alteromonas sp. BMJM2]|uniref:EF-hand domain-containing protein n=1 Tax=Alteromonas sp. BMJM2 TaxID=2954241 RepID=UPI0022B5A816|nr:EF-hand domain-containing protein [Alteromonas sp. BMJM2]
MKIATLTVVIGTVLSTSVLASHHETKIEKSFSALDMDGSGFVTKAEAKGTLHPKLLTKMDTDGDNKVSRAEFNLFVNEQPSMFNDDTTTSANTQTAAQPLMSEQKKMSALEGGEMISEKNKELRSQMSATADSRFTDLDKDSNGSLSTKELEASQVEGNISDMDTNGDKEITRIEYRAYFEKIESE